MRSIEAVSIAIRRVSPGPDYQAAFASPEDVILKKMDYYKQGRYQKHLRDIAGILNIWGKTIGLDEAYIESWASSLGLVEVWSLIQGSETRE